VQNAAMEKDARRGISVRLTLVSAAAAERVFSLLFGHVTTPVTDTSPTCHYRRRRRVDARPAAILLRRWATEDYATSTIGCKSNGGSGGL